MLKIVLCIINLIRRSSRCERRYLLRVNVLPQANMKVNTVTVGYKLTNVVEQHYNYTKDQVHVHVHKIVGELCFLFTSSTILSFP